MLSLRYRLSVSGVDSVALRGRSGILFLANHPALIDPMILATVLYRRFRPRPLGDQNQIDRFFVRRVARHLGAIEIPDTVVDPSLAVPEIESALDECAAALERDENLLVYPSGHLMTSRFEDLRGNSAAHRLAMACPNARVVLVRTYGLWGSRFSRAAGEATPSIRRLLPGCARDALLSGLFFMPRRNIRIELEEPDDIPRAADRETFNGFLEAYFNCDAPPLAVVPATPWQRGGTVVLEDPATTASVTSAPQVGDSTRRQVLAELRRLSGADVVSDSDHLARDLGLDSLVRVDLVAWLGEEFGVDSSDVDALQTVGDVLLAAHGEALSSRQAPLQPIPSRWFGGRVRRSRPTLPAGGTINEVFLERALSEPDTVILADQTGGVRSYRDLLTAVFVLRPLLERLPGEKVGLMLPASLGADVLYLALLFAGKTPVMVNWTVGPRNVTLGLDAVGVSRVLTARALVERLQPQGVEFSGYSERFLFLEEMRSHIGVQHKVAAVIRARATPRDLLSRAVPETAVVLFTSGSESTPKAVPLTHRNLLANLSDIAGSVPFEPVDRLLSMLPPFHSFGLTAGVLMPLLLGIPTVHHPNPREAAMLVRLVQTYGVTLIGGTPTFLSGMMRASRPGQLSGLRLAVTGGETCPDRVHDGLAAHCPNAQILEGYGVTECSPIVSINTPGGAKRGTIGRVLPSLDHRVVHPDSKESLAQGEDGVLMVRGPSVFSGYLGERCAGPFEDWGGQRWFVTGDIVREDDGGWLTFRGRAKRFVKLGGEMISLPAIESVLEEIYGGDEEGPILAVSATVDDLHPEIVLVTTFEVDRASVNSRLRKAGFSALHNIRRVVRVEEIPVLGTGKTDYRALSTQARHTHYDSSANSPSGR